MQEPKVHMLKSGMIADKLIIILLLTVVVILSVYFTFFKSKVECNKIDTQQYETTRPADYTITTNKKK